MDADQNLQATKDGESQQPAQEEQSVDIRRDIKDIVHYLIFNPEANHVLMPLLIIFESLALKWIIRNVDYTEIDYEAYMEQIWAIKDGERNYKLIEGGTGPLVYPAGHVWIYRAMEIITEGLDDLKSGQTVFRYLYIVTLMLQMGCYALLQLPPWCVALAVFSKRLHSIYVLRLFNDCFTTLFMVFTVFMLLLSARMQQRALCIVASASYSMAVSIKMNALLYLPGVLLAIFKLSEGRLAFTLGCIGLIVGWQYCIALPFVQQHPREYWSTAFDFGRQFMYKWSINWQFVDQEVFEDPWFHRTLLVSQVATLALLLLTRFHSDISEVWASMRALRHPFTPVLSAYQGFNRPSMPDIGYILLVTNFVGVVFSRSLHYQFLSWYHWTLPVMLYWSKLPLLPAVVWYTIHEYCWNSYPPNAAASAGLFTVNSLLLLVLFLQTQAPKTPKLTNVMAKKIQ
ncbi:LADA_0H09274g1_1 [Lachancea dasiensis]|uniref:Dol-P-Man:Man(5)GlcNAc(2)-PP-Dol alpha-1,3-mannosyltransferase n=1 Tax=Lachancea dasiensis TaxID=1072105 RepID=A0A1G4K303_9SACH|nr:LADA_0H09274g1_1 [Lachancea dasiensis]